MNAETTVDRKPCRQRRDMELLCMLSTAPAKAAELQADLGNTTYRVLKILVNSLNRKGYGVVCANGPKKMGRVVYVRPETWPLVLAEATEYFESANGA